MEPGAAPGSGPAALSLSVKSASQLLWNAPKASTELVSSASSGPKLSSSSDIVLSHAISSFTHRRRRLQKSRTCVVDSHNRTFHLLYNWSQLPALKVHCPFCMPDALTLRAYVCFRGHRASRMHRTCHGASLAVVSAQRTCARRRLCSIESKHSSSLTQVDQCDHANPIVLVLIAVSLFHKPTASACQSYLLCDVALRSICVGKYIDQHYACPGCLLRIAPSGWRWCES